MNRTFKFNTLYIRILLLVLAFFRPVPHPNNSPSRKVKLHSYPAKLGFTVNRKDDLPLLEEVSRWLGTPYRYGGTTRTGADCSGFVGAVYKNVYHKSLQRTVVNIYNKDCQRIGKRRLKPGDLVFSTSPSGKKRTLNHMGIYLKNGYFAHASTSKGVMVNHLSENYYKKGWRKSGRVW